MPWSFLAPAQLPGLDQLLVDLCNPSADSLSLLLGVSRRAVFGWKSAGVAPRAAMLALFWETSWGRSLLDCETVNAARVARGLVDALERENATLRARVAYLEAVADFGSANAPTYGPAPPRSITGVS